ncbi:sortase [Lactobacillus delbrueckii]|uniref:sortase n=1 Tax=Lactobacillus delbrueckii TaxID=1584 RepID=UPI000EA08F64|nr:sortase [Lactobacillus delbrueckii]MCD5530849.1 sortase [Lactobacillus delbrueckii subsp. lactis]MCD5533501.1 sortase [Lactobacillus delbrueckii subsp. lactis]MCS8615358.1 sortase [Lactobacillus delbrueckii subsp. lactis]
MDRDFGLLFTDLPRMKKGDVFYVHNLGKTLAYKVDQIKVIKTTQVDQLKIVKGKDLCTWIPYNPKAEAKAKERIRNRLFWIIIAILLPVLAIIIFICHKKRKKKKAKADK